MQKCALEDIKVVDFSRVAAGPIVGKYLADYGAQVIKVESRESLDLTRVSEPFKDRIVGPDRSGIFVYFNTSKYSIALNLKHPQGIEISKRLVKWADVVVENFRPGTMRRLGLDYEELRKIKDDIIMLSLSVAGNKGVYPAFAGYGYMGAAMTGHYHVTGWPDREPTHMGSIALADVVQPLCLVVGVMAALDYRKRTGKGQYIDSSQMEPMVELVGPAMLDYMVNGNQCQRNGNRHSYAAPHGAFRCKGDDKWCGIAIFGDNDWKAFCTVIEALELAEDPRFATLSSRKENEDELERLVERWTIGYTPEEVMDKLQAAGLAAGVVQDASDIVDRDPQLKEREAFLLLDHPTMGSFGHPSPPFKLSKTPSQMRTAPTLGEHTEYVCRQVLGMSDAEFIELLEMGVLE